MTHRHHAKALYLFLALFLTLSSLHALAATFEEYHTFTDVSGRQITAKVLSYNPDAGTVNLLLSNGKKGAITTEQLSADDLVYLDRWLQAAPLFSDKLLEINVSLKEEKWTDSGHSGRDRQERLGTYDISLVYRGQTTLTNLYIEYCEYRNKRSRLAPDKYIAVDNTGIEIGNLESGQTFDANPEYKSYREGKTFLNEVVGARFRFMIPLSDGTLVMREVCVPGPLPLEKYPWQLSEKALALEKASMPDPAEYPDKELSEQDIERIARQYIQAWEENDFEAWRATMSPMHPGSSKLSRDRFQSAGAQYRSIEIIATDGNNVKVQAISAKGNSSEGWIQLHSSGHIKYTPFVFKHPVYIALVRLPHLISQDSNKDGAQRILETEVPLFEYDVDGDMNNWEENTEKILNWIRKHGAAHDVSEPMIFLPKEKLDQMIRWAEGNIEGTKQTATGAP